MRKRHSRALVKVLKKWYCLSMNFPERIETVRPGVELRKLTKDNVGPYLVMLQANGEHLSRHAAAHKDAKDKTVARRQIWKNLINELIGDEVLHMGLWDHETLVAGAELRPGADNAAEVGCWVDKDHLRNGYASLALGAISEYGLEHFELLWGDIANTNVASIQMVRTQGYRLVHQHPLANPLRVERRR